MKNLQWISQVSMYQFELLGLTEYLTRFFHFYDWMLISIQIQMTIVFVHRVQMIFMSKDILVEIEF